MFPMFTGRTIKVNIQQYVKKYSLKAHQNKNGCWLVDKKHAGNSKENV